MSLTWIKHKLGEGGGPRLSLPDTSTVVTESLLMELDHQINEMTQVHKMRDLQEKRERGQVDYTWLVSKPTKSYQMPQVERFELEELCSKVLPTECGRIIEVFRVSMAREPQVNEIPRIMRTVILQTLEDRPKDDDSWLSKGLENLKAMTNSNRVTPVNPDLEAMELSGRTIYERSKSADPVFTIHNEMNM